MIGLGIGYFIITKKQRKMHIKITGTGSYIPPEVIKEYFDKAAIDITKVKKKLIHQANEKMDEAIVKRLYKLDVPEGIMPMSIHNLGNSSVATIPTLLGLILKKEK